jgi:serine/threonine protein kinase
MRFKVAVDIAEGMAFLHSLNPPLLHRDLKSPNILVGTNEKRQKRKSRGRARGRRRRARG